jgi:uncharacterized protein (TIGR00661 family)
MAKIFYSLSGEGRGHATRVRTMVEALRPDHEVVLFAPGDAYEMLAPHYSGTGVRVYRIPGLHFHYDRHVLSFWRTTHEATRYLWKLPRLISWLELVIRKESPDLIITDFEPALPRAAQRVGIPFISLDHQHFLVANDLDCLPNWMQLPAKAMGLVVRGFYSGQAETILSQFYAPPLRRDMPNVTQIGVLLRPEILQTQSTSGEHLVAYLRRKTSSAVLASLKQLGRPVYVYGLGELPSQENLQFCRIDEHGFIAHMASSHSVVCTAGNQLVGEALYLGKPVLALPESNNFEQFINAWFLRDSGGGDWVDPDRITIRHLQRFLAQRDDFAGSTDRTSMNGTPPALEILSRYLPKSSPKVMTRGNEPQLVPLAIHS